MIYLTLIGCFITSIVITPFVKKIAFIVGATDHPSQRKVHQTVMPRLGGLAIYISFMVGFYVLRPLSVNSAAIIIGGAIMILIGVFDDILDLSAKVKFAGQLAAAFVVVFLGELQVVFINVPLIGRVEFGFFSIPFTILWIAGITNAINLIDGLDGLAAGVSSIALITIAGMAFLTGNLYVVIVSLLLLASTLGFLIYNFHPAKIFMGDTGALFLGFMIAVLSLLGYKHVTFISLIVPIIILGVPISDTFFAIVRRIINRQPLSAPDKSHLHHCMLRLGFTHRQTVLLIYSMSMLFGLAAVIYSEAKLWGSFILIAVLLIFVELIAEKVGLIGKDFHPILRFMRNLKLSTGKVLNKE
jgi:UDP-GlcNAc:undecaprenyl-phosphate GlcNAc-1-phosphate transferase